MDEELTRLERQWRSSGQVADHAAWIAAAMRAGALDRELVRDAAELGHAAAGQAVGAGARDDVEPGERLAAIEQRLLEARQGAPAAELERACHALCSRAVLAAAHAVAGQWDASREAEEEETGERWPSSEALILSARALVSGTPGPFLEVAEALAADPAWLDGGPDLRAWRDLLDAARAERGCGPRTREAAYAGVWATREHDPGLLVREVGTWLVSCGADGPPHALRAPAGARAQAPAVTDREVERLRGAPRERLELAALLGHAPAAQALAHNGVPFEEAPGTRTLLERRLPPALERVGAPAIVRAILAAVQVDRARGGAHPGGSSPWADGARRKLAAVDAWLARPSGATLSRVRDVADEVPCGIESNAAWACAAPTATEALGQLRQALARVMPAEHPALLAAMRERLIPWLLAEDAAASAPEPQPPPEGRGWLRRLFGG
ncbi:MAG: hypothetical protein M9894_37885 [Planctomycetes bacterium]|nr:hypothetical protein [Planctomycetota bacterium]